MHTACHFWAAFGCGVCWFARILCHDQITQWEGKGRQRPTDLESLKSEEKKEKKGTRERDCLLKMRWAERVGVIEGWRRCWREWEWGRPERACDERGNGDEVASGGTSMWVHEQRDESAPAHIKKTQHSPS
jgi:hypothetical protein